MLASVFPPQHGHLPVVVRRVVLPPASSIPQITLLVSSRMLVISNRTVLARTSLMTIRIVESNRVRASFLLDRRSLSILFLSRR